MTASLHKRASLNQISAVVSAIFSSLGVRVNASLDQSNYIAYNLIIITIHCSIFQLMTWN